jgi:hypothetical protein
MQMKQQRWLLTLLRTLQMQRVCLLMLCRLGQTTWRAKACLLG